MADATRVALIGGSGFVGSNLCRRLLHSDNYDVKVFDLVSDKVEMRLENRLDLLDFTRMDIAEAGGGLEEAVRWADVVVNMPAFVRPASFVSDPLSIVDLNFFDNLKVIEACVKEGKFLVHFSTSEVYGKTGGSDAAFREDETDCILGPIENHRWIYSCAKQLLDRIIHAHGMQNGLNFFSVRPFNFVGPLMDYLYSDPKSQETPRVLASFASALLYDQPLKLVNGGKSRRCFTYIDDAVDAIELLIRNRMKVNRRIVNVGVPGNETTIHDLAHLVRDIYRKEHNPDVRSEIIEVSGDDFYGKGYEDCDRRLPDISRLQALGWKPKYDLRETFSASLAYISANRERLEAMNA